MDCQLKRDVNPFVVECFSFFFFPSFFKATAAKVFLRKTENINYFARVYTCNYHYVCVPFIKH